MNNPYTLYLVTDSTMIPESSTFLKQVEAAINNGVTMVQLREKKISTLEFINRAKQVHKLTKAKGIPLIINDRIDVALAIDAEGVHVGQDDMPAEIARKLIGQNKILGVTCSIPAEVEEVTKSGVADYVGLGTVYQTNTKKNVTDPEGTGPIGIRKMLRVLQKYNQTHDKKINSVAIGGINHSNADKVMYECRIEQGEGIDGIAVVSCIMASEDAGKATKDLSKIVRTAPIWVGHELATEMDSANLRTRVSSTHPLVHHITNNVVKNFSANVTLAIGASPIMSELAEEFHEFASGIPNLSLVLNLGTPTSQLMSVFKTGIREYNKYGKPIVFDPVACGATEARLEASRVLLNSGHVSVIKGNLGEIQAIWKLTSYYKESTENEESLMRGVDSIAELTEEKIIQLGKQVANDFKTVVVITGKINYIIDENHIASINGGSELMGLVTGSGCSLGSTIGAFLAVSRDAHIATVQAVKLYNEAGRNAAANSSTPASFMISFVDELYRLMH